MHVARRLSRYRSAARLQSLPPARKTSLPDPGETQTRVKAQPRGSFAPAMQARACAYAARSAVQLTRGGLADKLSWRRPAHSRVKGMDPHPTHMPSPGDPGVVGSPLSWEELTTYINNEQYEVGRPSTNVRRFRVLEESKRGDAAGP